MIYVYSNERHQFNFLSYKFYDSSTRIIANSNSYDHLYDLLPTLCLYATTDDLPLVEGSTTCDERLYHPPSTSSTHSELAPMLAGETSFPIHRSRTITVLYTFNTRQEALTFCLNYPEYLL